MSNRFSNKRQDVQRPPVCKPSPPPPAIYDSQAGFIRFGYYRAILGTQITVDFFASYIPLPIGAPLTISGSYQAKNITIIKQPRNAMVSNPGRLTFNVGMTPGWFQLDIRCWMVAGQNFSETYDINVGPPWQ